jgi:hypothetical protein
MEPKKAGPWITVLVPYVYYMWEKKKKKKKKKRKEISGTSKRFVS